jgi:hypothetical protein
MIRTLRSWFNSNWTPEKYAHFLRILDEGSGTHVPFRCSETPVFLPVSLTEKLSRYAVELIEQCMEPEYLKRSDQTIPAEYCVPNENPRPLFIQVDFGLDAQLEPKLVEIQAFPSLYAFQPFLAECYRETYGLPGDLSAYLSGFEEASYQDLLSEAILGEHKPGEVVLLEIDPQHQKTLCDFNRTEKMLGVKAVCVTHVEKRGRKLYHDGRPIERIYNRAIVDELVRKGVRPGFDYRDELEVEWAGHPNWYFRISKFTIPFLRHVSVPKTVFLDQVLSGGASLPDDLENWVLKPLYSFAGTGVVIGPAREEIYAIEDPSQYILQERIDFAPTIETPHGPTKQEIRVMCIWPDDAPRPLPVTTIIRTGRGKMMGVDHNKGLEWVGASAAFHPGR